MSKVSPEQLTEAQKACLRFVFARLTAKQMALELGITPDAVSERLRAARQRLGVATSMEAAILLAKAEQADPYKQPVDGPIGIVPDLPVEALSPSPRLPLPWRTTGRPVHDRRIYSTLVGATIAFVILTAATVLMLNAVSLLYRAS